MDCDRVSLRVICALLVGGIRGVMEMDLVSLKSCELEKLRDNVPLDMVTMHEEVRVLERAWEVDLVPAVAVAVNEYVAVNE